jgi:hypothetical protein
MRTFHADNLVHPRSWLAGLVVMLLIQAGWLCAQVPAPGSEGKIKLPWLSDYDQALKKAAAGKQPIVMDITTDWCGWSKKMDRETFADEKVQERLKACVLVRLNPESSEANEKIGERYGVDGYPTLVVANYLGEEIGKSSGYMEPKEFLEFLDRYLPEFKSNPLGYQRAKLPAEDPLMKALARLPAPEARPTSAGSLLVLDATEIRLQTNGAAKFLERSAYYIVDPEKKDLPEACLRYVSPRQKARFVHIRILDTNGVGREINVKLAKDEHAYSNQNVYWDARSLGLDLPTLKEGQVVDILDERESAPILDDEFFFRWRTGLKFMLESDLKITFPSSVKLQHCAVRCPGIIVATTNGDSTITWNLKTSSLQAYEPEYYSPDYSEIWQGHDFYTSCSPDAIARWYAELCQGRHQLPESARLRVAELKKANPDKPALLQAIFDWVTKDIRYVSVQFGAASHQPHLASDTLTNLYGDCKDQALLLQSLCREAGIPASLVLFGDYFANELQHHQGVEMFDHCLLEAQLDGKPCFLDATAGRSVIGRLPPGYSRRQALKLDGTNGTIITLPLYQPRLETVNRTGIKLNLNGSATITQIFQAKGVAAARAKLRMKGTTVEKVKKSLQESYKRGGRKLVDFTMTDPNGAGDEYETRLVFTVPRFGSATAGGMAFKLSPGQESDWIAALNSRTQPFQFDLENPEQAIYEVELPAGTVLKSRPDDLQLDTPFLKASRKIVQSDNKITLTEDTQILDARLPVAEAAAVHAAFQKLQDHRDFTVIVAMPPPAAPAAQ